MWKSSILFFLSGSLLYLQFRKQQQNMKLKKESKCKKIINENEESSNLTCDKPSIEIEYCFKCKWGLRAGWMALEILQTFENEIDRVSLIPSHTGGTYIITAVNAKGRTTIWNRKINNGFPDAKDIKNFIKEAVFPEKELGRCLKK